MLENASIARFLGAVTLILFSGTAAGAAPRGVKTESASPVSTVSREQLEELPTNRRLEDLLRTCPAQTIPTAGGGTQVNLRGLGATAQPSINCIRPDDIAMIDVYRAHNSERSLYGYRPLVWNITLADGAQNYANQLARTGQLVHASREGRGTVRENLSSGLPNWTANQLMGNWLGEKPLFRPGIFPDVSISGDWSQVGHYSQMIWPTTTDIGCGLAVGGRFSWLVCRYDPGGNKDGKPVGYAAMPSPRHIVSSTPSMPSPRHVVGMTPAMPTPRQVVGSTPATVPVSDPQAAPQSSAASSNKPVANENFTTQRRVAFCGHMWIIIDDYDNQGKKVGEISLHFSPDGFTINPTSQDFYPTEFAFGVESTRAADLRLLEMWRYQAANKGDIPVDLPLIGPWSPANNCITQSMMWAWYGIETNEPVRKATEWPVDCEITPEPDWAEKKRRLGLAWDNADTVSEHLDVMQMAVKQAFWSAVGNCFDSDE